MQRSKQIWAIVKPKLANVINGMSFGFIAVALPIGSKRFPGKTFLGRKLKCHLPKHRVAAWGWGWGAGLRKSRED